MLGLFVRVVFVHRLAPTVTMGIGSVLRPLIALLGLSENRVLVLVRVPFGSSKVGVGAPALVQSKAARGLATAVTFISVTGFASPADAGAHRLMKPNLAHLRLGNSMPKLWTWRHGLDSRIGKVREF